MAPTNRSMEDMVPLQGLRGVCAMAIFLGHQTDVYLTSPWQQQRVVVGLEYLQAVSLFFLLSGIPLARLYSSSMLETWQGLRTFWIKRVARLAPVYYLTLCYNLSMYFLIFQQVDWNRAWRSFVTCALFLQCWITNYIGVGGVLWQVSVFCFCYALYPWCSRCIKNWSPCQLLCGIVPLWLWGVGTLRYFRLVDGVGVDDFTWHISFYSRFPQFLAGVLLGEWMEKTQRQQSTGDNDGDNDDGDNDDGDNDDGGDNNGDRDKVAYCWAVITDAFSVVLLVTAIQAILLEWYHGSSFRFAISYALEAWFLPIHATWLAGIVLSYRPTINEDDSSCLTRMRRDCWTRRVLSFPPLIALGDVSLVLYCIHFSTLEFYTSAYAYIQTGDWYLYASNDAVSVPRVQAPWWHAPFQWFLVITLSFAVSKWYEAPLRKMIAPRSGQQAVPTTEPAEDVEESIGLVVLNPANKDERAQEDET